MRIAVVGVGAMGCLLGAYLSRVSDVVLLGDWLEQVIAIRNNGLWIEHPDGSRSHHELSITGSPERVRVADVSIIAVKSRQTELAARETQRFLTPEGVALTLQNGLNNRATLSNVLGANRVALGVTSEGATVLTLGAIRHAGHGPTYIGVDPILGSSQASFLAELAGYFNEAGFETHLVEDTDALVWGKLAVNAAINPLTALLKVPNGVLIEHEELVAIMRRASTETAAVALAQGINLPDGVSERAMVVAEATAANYSSMLQDVLRGAPTEIDAICGAITRAGVATGTPTPVNARLAELVLRLENGMPPVETGDVLGVAALLEESMRD